MSAAPHAAASWGGDMARAIAIVVAAALLGIVLNSFSRKPVPLLAGDGPGAPPPQHPRITVEQLKDAFDKGRLLMIVDVRSPQAFAAGHPFGAQNAHAPKFMDRYPELSKHMPGAESVVLMCESEQCPYADRVAKLLIDAGHDNIKVLHGGWKAYAAAGLPVEKGQAP
ncbi:MAG TPA: rhodanese-like domain-containing protein [Planctomycetota bacterium]|nr:rhodanese-like domain-containing protein [Planctomycetota bacterium]